MKIYLPNTSQQSIGGGWTFRRNLQKGLSDVNFMSEWRNCDIVLITGATMTNRDEMNEAKKADKKIVFRVDNIPKDSRNRGTAFSRMIDYAKMSDWIIFQSEWAKDYAGWWFEKNGVSLERSSVIYNGIDPQFFFEDSQPAPNRENRYLYVRYNRDENKRDPEAFYIFHQAFRKNPQADLVIVGQFGDDNVKYNFDFFAGEKVYYEGVIEEPAVLGRIMRSCKYFLFPAFADASPNSLLEAISCGCVPLGINPIGGSEEVCELKGRTVSQMADEYREVFSKLLN